MFSENIIKLESRCILLIHIKENPKISLTIRQLYVTNILLFSIEPITKYEIEKKVYKFYS